MRNLVLLTFAAVLALGACEPESSALLESPAATSAKPIRVAGLYWPGRFWADIAHSKGWFKEAGLNVEWVDTNPDYFASLEDPAAG